MSKIRKKPAKRKKAAIPLSIRPKPVDTLFEIFPDSVAVVVMRSGSVHLIRLNARLKEGANLDLRPCGDITISHQTAPADLGSILINSLRLLEGGAA